ncbi:ATP-grasp peptide maturase system methyltransferase [Kitasatospora purpeofusca]|uniref:ATP-grasp peptide maturase system methyltransferase n=1 Tax=Kitasatospora purpeofusca TaxID=67352 RepID=UPI0022519B5F|nr:ATP-grasp peptide maturase system methyltransferase [Kitasatospora purpeofusca]MCX4752175.1 ATP-grasp peptide maturase system methyltransferase [Kitasatospora purpeofusca]WSR31771.1 ATP-grasp peptide maturase system methyltransferase [Kitasatospora purpeofusca]
MTTSAILRAALVEQLTENGTLADPAWAAAAAAVPRELFTGSYFDAIDGSSPTAYRTLRHGDPGWLEGVYTDRTLVTQLDGRTHPEDAGERPVTGAPSSSSTLPSLVLGMWQRLGAEAGHRVLEVGTGTGYSTALGAHRLGDGNVTSIEYDPRVAARAAAALRAAGYAPRLLTGDGLGGDPHAGAFDRLIATCSVRYLPMAWLHQVRPGGRILVTLSGWSYANALALLDVTGPGEATGRFLPGFTSFMIARPHDRPPRPTLALLPGEERPSRIDPAKLDTWTGSWIAQLAAPSAERMGGGAQQILSDVATGSQARTVPDPAGGWTVVQRGPLRLWDEVEAAVETWQDVGEPHQVAFGITVSAAGQRIWLGTEDGTGWNLPI